MSRSTTTLPLQAAVLAVALLGIFLLVRPQPAGPAAPGVSGAPSSPTAGATIGPGSTDAASRRYPDGIPTALAEGRVLRGTEGIQRARAATDASHFLIGAWYVANVHRTCGLLIGFTLENRCARWVIGELPGSYDLSRWVSMDGKLAPPESGPVVLEVHANDARAEQCEVADTVARCRAIMVVDRVVCAGDETTATAPIAASDAVERSRWVADRLGPSADDPSIAPTLVAAAIARDACSLPLPVNAFAMFGDPRLRAVLVFASVDDRAAHIEALESATEADLTGCEITLDPEGPGVHWLAVDNVVLAVQNSDEAFDALMTTALIGKWTGSPPPFVGPARWKSSLAVDMVTAFVVGQATGQGENAYSQLTAPLCCAGSVEEDVFRRYLGPTVPHVALTNTPPTEDTVGSRFLSDAAERGASSLRAWETTVDDWPTGLRAETFLTGAAGDGSWLLWIVDAAAFPPDPYEESTPTVTPGATSHDTRCSPSPGSSGGECG